MILLLVNFGCVRRERDGGSWKEMHKVHVFTASWLVGTSSHDYLVQQALTLRSGGQPTGDSWQGNTSTTDTGRDRIPTKAQTKPNLL